MALAPSVQARNSACGRVLSHSDNNTFRMRGGINLIHALYKGGGPVLIDLSSGIRASGAQRNLEQHITVQAQNFNLK